MKDALNFIQSFVQFDFKVRSEQWTQPDDQYFHDNLDKLNNFYFGEIQSNINRESPVHEAYLAEGKKYLKTLQQKKIFQIKKYKHAQYKELYCAYLSSDFIGGDSYFIKLYFTLINKSYKIIAEYYLCSDCDGTGFFYNNICNECDGQGWTWQGGIKLNITDPPVDVVKLLKPANEVHLKEFESNEV